MVDELDGRKIRAFDEGSPEGHAVREWWRQLQGYGGASDATLAQLNEDGMKSGWPGLRAELRRAETEVEAVFCRAYQQLRWKMPENFRYEPSLSAVARVLAHVKTLPPANELAMSLPRRMGNRKADSDDTPVVSELRFKRLLRIEETGEFADLLIRLLPLVARTANPLTLARDIWYWNHPSSQTRKDWANDYYQALLGLTR